MTVVNLVLNTCTFITFLLATQPGGTGIPLHECMHETELTTLLLSCGTVGLLNEVVAAGRPNDLLMVDLLE